MPPQRVNIDDCEAAVPLLGYGDAQCLTAVVNEIVRVKELLP